MTSLPDRKLTGRPFHLPRGLRGVQAVAQDAASRSCIADRCQARWGRREASVKQSITFRSALRLPAAAAAIARAKKWTPSPLELSGAEALGSPRACSLSGVGERG